MNKELEEFNNSLKDKKVAVIGAGVSNLPLFSYLNEVGALVTLFDKKKLEDLSSSVKDCISKYKINLSLGDNYLENLVGFDVIFRSPSCLPTNPYLACEIERGAVVTTEVAEVVRLAPCKVIGVTGSDGKTTTTTLIAKMLEKLGYRVFLGGNIGKPIFTSIKDMKSDDIVVLELSSFQLMDMEVSPDISVITNISPNHLDIHGTYQEYIDAKKNIFKHQNSDGIVVLNYDDELVRSFDKEARGEVRYFSSRTNLDDSYVLEGEYIKYNDEIIIDTKDLKIRGRHNYINICTALSAIHDYVDLDKVLPMLKSFGGVNHRIEFIRELDGVKWYTDSASSTPTRTIAGIRAFSEPIVLIAGGSSKNISYAPLAKPIIDNVSKLILFGATKNKIYDAVMEEVRRNNSDLKIYVLDTLEEVVSVAKEISVPGEVVLFSPASASFDMFKNAYQRGDLFKEMVNKL